MWEKGREKRMKERQKETREVKNKQIEKRK